MMLLSSKSVYFCYLSDISGGRYETKVTATGLNVDPYVIDGHKNQ